MTVFSFLPPSHRRWELAAPKLSAAWLDNIDIFYLFGGPHECAEGVLQDLEPAWQLGFHCVLFYLFFTPGRLQADGKGDHGCGLDIIAGVLNKHPLRYCWRICVFFALL
ncbi:uncharacterized protein LY79DRAFT_204870 [Colletotrichum navitas]|uniref:Uncharacterized protein n=1 Tax=Colletotrichum navitas TaxID=681940 RepID=A0AAD8QDF8_9PEZI|nr:uncharacterized protein LY79DRAFT_204870 [Colletotrichum navitas]KAK1598994.1 hypothetical protein LY79DRAFT_204870 [Colletotrichum navitas]